MYNAAMKVGNLILVHGCRPSVGTSTLAAMTASFLSFNGEKTLLLTTDADAPFDAVSMLSSDIADDHMDELVVLENSNGLTENNLDDYISTLTNNLGYLRASTKLSRLTKDPARTVQRIVDTAMYSYRYVVVDIGYDYTSYADVLLKKSDLVLHVLGQDPKGLARAQEIYARGGFGENTFMVPVVADFIDDATADVKSIGKQLKIDTLFTLDHDADIYKAVQSRDVAGFVQKNTKKKTGFLSSLMGKKRTKNSADDDSYIDELGQLISKITQALTPEEVDSSDGNR